MKLRAKTTKNTLGLLKFPSKCQQKTIEKNCQACLGMRTSRRGNKYSVIQANLQFDGIYNIACLVLQSILLLELSLFQARFVDMVDMFEVVIRCK